MSSQGWPQQEYFGKHEALTCVVEEVVLGCLDKVRRQRACIYQLGHNLIDRPRTQQPHVHLELILSRPRKPRACIYYVSGKHSPGRFV